MSYINIESSLGTKFISNDCYDYEASSSGSSPLYHTALSNPQSPFFRIPERYVVASVPPPLPPNPSSSPLGTLQDRPSSDDRTVARHSQINIQKQGVAPHPGRPRITVDTSLPFRQRSKYLGHSTYAYSASADGPRQYPTSLSHPPGSKSALPKPKQRSSFVRPSRLCTTVNNIYTCAICNGGRGQANGNHISYSADDVTQLASPFLSSSFGRHAAAITAASTAGSTPQNDNELVSSASERRSFGPTAITILTYYFLKKISKPPALKSCDNALQTRRIRLIQSNGFAAIRSMLGISLMPC